jgi:DNA repair exonuclease SbcCD ATPase subunit
MYCQFHGLHNIPLADDLSPQQLETIMKDLRSLRRFFTRDTQYSLTRSRYSDKVIMKSGKTWAARFLTASVDLQRKAELERQIQEAQGSVSAHTERYSDLQKSEEALHKEDTKLRQEKNQLKVKIDSYKQAQSNISSRETRLRGIENTTFDLAAEEEKTRQEVDKIHEKRVEVLIDLRKKLEESKEKLAGCGRAWVLVTLANLKVTQLLHRHRVAKTKLDNAEQIKIARESVETQMKTRVQRLLQTAREVSGIQNDPQEDPELISERGDTDEDQSPAAAPDCQGSLRHTERPSGGPRAHQYIQHAAWGAG